MHPVRRGATTRGLDPVGHGVDRAAPREGAIERERGEGATNLKHNGYSCHFIKERGAEILDPSYRRHNFTFFEEFK